MYWGFKFYDSDRKRWLFLLFPFLGISLVLTKVLNDNPEILTELNQSGLVDLISKLLSFLLISGVMLLILYLMVYIMGDVIVYLLAEFQDPRECYNFIRKYSPRNLPDLIEIDRETTSSLQSIVLTLHIVGKSALADLSFEIDSTGLKIIDWNPKSIPFIPNEGLKLHVKIEEFEDIPEFLEDYKKLKVEISGHIIGKEEEYFFSEKHTVNLLD